MSAQPVERGVHRSWSPDPVRQHEASYTVEDVLTLPDGAPRVELRSGVITVVPSPTMDHQGIQFLLQRWLWDRVPADHVVRAAVGVAVGLTRTFEPDVLIVRQSVPGSSHYALPAQVLLAVEIVSPATRKRDRLEKPADYAAAGIPFYWRIEQDPVRVFAYELAPGSTYRLVAEADRELVLTAPFEIKLAIGDITP